MKIEVIRGKSVMSVVFKGAPTLSRARHKQPLSGQETSFRKPCPTVLLELAPYQTKQKSLTTHLYWFTDSVPMNLNLLPFSHGT